MHPPATAAATQPAARRRWIAATCALFVLAMVAVRWDARTGFTSLLRFGETFAGRRLAAVDAAPVRTYPGHGYDGQFYAQIAVAGNPAAPELGTAIDNVRYRARRILLPALAHVLGGGHARAILNVYALFNVAAWLLLGWRLWKLTTPLGRHGDWVWAATLLGLGVLDSVRLALADLPVLLVMVAAIELAQTGRRLPAVALLAAGGLVKEVAPFAAAALQPPAAAPRRTWLTAAAFFAVAMLPLAGWTWWLEAHVAAGNAAGAGNAGWPGLALLRHGATCLRELAAGNFDGRYSFGLLAAGSFAYQAMFILRRWRDPSPWIRLGLPFAVLFWLLGDGVWHGYWAVARALLPLTLAFNLSLPRDQTFPWRLLAGNVCLLHGVWRMLPD